MCFLRADESKNILPQSSYLHLYSLPLALFVDAPFTLFIDLFFYCNPEVEFANGFAPLADAPF